MSEAEKREYLLNRGWFFLHIDTLGGDSKEYAIKHPDLPSYDAFGFESLDPVENAVELQRHVDKAREEGRQEEQEACAKLAESAFPPAFGPVSMFCPRELGRIMAERIRARGET